MMSPLFLVTIMGAVFAFGGLIAMFDSRYKVRHCSEKAAGRVAQIVVRERVIRRIEDHKNKDANRHLLCSPVIAFQAGDENVEEIYFRASRPCPYNEGDEVSVLYNPNRPHSYMIEGDGTADGIAIAFLITGFIMIVGSLLLVMQVH